MIHKHIQKTAEGETFVCMFSSDSKIESIAAKKLKQHGIYQLFFCYYTHTCEKISVHQA